MDTKKKLGNPQLRTKTYRIFSFVLVLVLAFLFAFPLYWIITGAFKPGADINASEPVWFPTDWVKDNFENLMSRRTAPLFDFKIGNMTIEGPRIPAAAAFRTAGLYLPGVLF